MEIFPARPIFNINAHDQKHIGIEHNTICSVSGQFDVPWLREQGQGVTQALGKSKEGRRCSETNSMTHCSGLGNIKIAAAVRLVEIRGRFLV